MSCNQSCLFIYFSKQMLPFPPIPRKEMWIPISFPSSSLSWFSLFSTAQPIFPQYPDSFCLNLWMWGSFNSSKSYSQFLRKTTSVYKSKSRTLQCWVSSTSKMIKNRAIDIFFLQEMPHTVFPSDPMHYSKPIIKKIEPGKYLSQCYHNT